MAGTTPIYGIPYPESSDLVANYPALGEGLADKLEDKLPTFAATAPTSPSVGQVWIDSTGSPIGKVWDGSAWTIFSGAGAANFSDTATGTYTDGGIDYKYITYTGSSTLTVTNAGLADILVIGGAGAGGCATGGGGGAGGHLEIIGAYLGVATHSVIVGAGGAGFTTFANVTGRPGTNGLTSRLGNYFSPGGGGGGAQLFQYSGAAFAFTPGEPGGSGGGGSRSTSAGGPGVTSIGNSGGTGSTTSSGGGGGAGAAGSNGSGSAGGAGGAGLANSFTGSSVTRAGGGGGQGDSSSGAGGSGGGGAAVLSGVATSGTANTGSGGGGTGSLATSTSGAGGSGLVIVRVKV